MRIEEPSPLAGFWSGVANANGCAREPRRQRTFEQALEVYCNIRSKSEELLSESTHRCKGFEPATRQPKEVVDSWMTRQHIPCASFHNPANSGLGIGSLECHCRGHSVQHISDG